MRIQFAVLSPEGISASILMQTRKLTIYNSHQLILVNVGSVRERTTTYSARVQTFGPRRLDNYVKNIIYLSNTGDLK